MVKQLAADFGPCETGHLADAVALLGLAVAEAAHAQIRVEVLRGDGHGFLAGLEQQLLDRLASDLGELALEIAHAGLAGVEADHVLDGGVRDHQFIGLQPVLLDLLRQQVAARDVALLILGVAGDADDLHAVQERRRNVQAVRRAHEHHFGQIEIHLEVVVVEGAVLLRIEHLEQRRGRIAAEVGRHLVDFVQQEQRVAHAALGEILNDLAGHGADVGAAVAADLGLIAHAAQGHAHEFAVGGARHALAQGGLADSGRTDQAQDRDRAGS